MFFSSGYHIRTESNVVIDLSVCLHLHCLFSFSFTEPFDGNNVAKSVCSIDQFNRIHMKFRLVCVHLNLIKIIIKKSPQVCWGQGWRSGKSTRLPLNWPGLIPGHGVVWEFVIGSCPCSRAQLFKARLS